jgi:hypothetical protein
MSAARWLTNVVRSSSSTISGVIEVGHGSMEDESCKAVLVTQCESIIARLTVVLKRPAAVDTNESVHMRSGINMAYGWRQSRSEDSYGRNKLQHCRRGGAERSGILVMRNITGPCRCSETV